MAMIKYQGRRIKAELIAEWSGGGVGYLCGRRRSGNDELWRDKQGRYYARQERYDSGTGGLDRHSDHYFEGVHRISLSAAILWMVSLSGYQGLALRRDAAQALKELAEQNREADLDDPVCGSNLDGRRHFTNSDDIALLAAASPANEQKGGQ